MKENNIKFGACHPQQYPCNTRHDNMMSYCLLSS